MRNEELETNCISAFDYLSVRCFFDFSFNIFLYNCYGIVFFFAAYPNRQLLIRV